MNTLIKLAGAGAFALAAAAAQSAPIVSLSALGETTTSVAGATTIDFNSGCGYATCSGDFQIVLGSASGLYAQPAGTNTEYLTVPNPISSGSATFTLDVESDYFGLYWGSIDAYNSISFYLDGSLISTYSGSDLVGQFANGNQVNFSSNRYINFDFGNAKFDTVKLTSTSFAFESDNHAFRNLATVPEPSTLLLILGGLLSLAGVRLRKAQ
ncbi:PEP-CTERM sorting domain-containing protein [Cellvibrio sp. UBA7671]|uniref:Npun_F0296 family exosortase-dependent surface protein n=1 Tax=Cellvibrio sp. UBA7671 TaxID=1946312 RepID=UPI002F35A6D1